MYQLSLCLSLKCKIKSEHIFCRMLVQFQSYKLAIYMKYRNNNKSPIKLNLKISGEKCTSTNYTVLCGVLFTSYIDVRNVLINVLGLLMSLPTTVIRKGN
jgi:hypothetical protein